MQKSYYLSTTFNKVVFVNRNKNYGAFYLRCIYEKNIVMAVLIASSVFTIMLVAPMIRNYFFPKQVEHTLPTDTYTGTLVDIIPPTIAPAKPKTAETVVQPKKEKVKTEVYAKPKVVKDDAPITETALADQKDLANANFGTKKVEGNPPSIPDVALADVPPAGLGEGDKRTAPEIFIYVEEMPEFKGGENAMLQYIAKRINYPAMAQRQGLEGLVVVSFVVSESGKIKDATVLKGLGAGTDEEALRVIRGMPEWKPGRQNGRAVPVRYTVPIRFSIK